MELAGRRRVLVTIGVLTGMLLAALEATVVATAMPTVIASLGGFKIYTWVFSIYLLTSTVSMPIWGKLSDLYGRRRCYQVGIFVFLLGSALSGMSTTMTQLIIFRGVQGLGAGALIPLSLTITGEIYTLQERARMQGIFSSVWALSSILGPLLGGFITDHFSWRWVFYINIPIGLLAAVIIGVALIEPRREEKPPVIDIAGSLTLSIAISLLLLACLQSHEQSRFFSMATMVTALLFLLAFVRAEQRAVEPLLPLGLFRERMFLASVFGNLLAGGALFGTMTFIPLFLQGVMGTSAIEAGSALMPLLIGWVSFSVVGGRLLLRFGYRPVVLAGMIALAIGLALLALMPATMGRIYIYASLFVAGMGMGLSMITLLIAVQNSVPRHQLGVASSSTQFFRNIGGAVVTAVLGALMSVSITNAVARMQAQIEQAGVGGEMARIVANPNIFFHPESRLAVSEAAMRIFRSALASGLHMVFVYSFFIAIFAVAAALLVPAGPAVDVRAKDASLKPHPAD